MGPSRPQPTDEEWLRHKAAIRKLYIVEQVPLKKLVVEVASLGLAVTKAQLEYKLKQWSFRRNIDRETWVSISNRITKRQKEGKGSDVIYYGKRLKQSTIDKETKRHCHKAMLAQHASSLVRSSTPPDAAQVVVCTPPPLPADFEWPITLPWLRFQDKHLSSIVMENARWGTRLEAGGFRLARLRRFASTLVPIDSRLSLTRKQPHVSSLAADIGNLMPEAYPEEHLKRAQDLLHGSVDEFLHQCLTVTIYRIANNLIDLLGDAQWEETMDILRECRVLDLEANLRGLDEPTVQGFMENLFHAAIVQLTDPRRTRAGHKDTMAAVKWLLASGQDPNSGPTLLLQFSHTTTPLHVAIYHGKVELIECLLAAGANINAVLSYGKTISALELALECWRRDSPTFWRIVELLLEHGASVDLDTALRLAIWKRDLKLAASIVQKGADLCGKSRARTGVVYEETALSAAAAVGLPETMFILDLLATHHPSRPLAGFATPDVFIAAAEEGKDDVLRLLHNVTPAGGSPGPFGLTPLQAAASEGHLSTCVLLHQLYGFDTSIGCGLSPLHTAARHGYEEIVQFFIDDGADVNGASATGDALERQMAAESHLPTRNGLPSHPWLLCHTPLEAIFVHDNSMMTHLGGNEPGKLACAAALIRAGARLTGGEVIRAVRESHLEMLSAALAAGGNPNEKDDDGKSALHFAFERLHGPDTGGAAGNGAAVASLLVEKGATLARGEVLSAILLGNWDLVILMLKHGGSLMETDPEGMTALEAAILAQNTFVLDCVLDMFPDTYEPGSLCAAVATGAHALIDSLLAKRPPQAQPHILETTAVGLSAKRGDLSLLRKLLAHLPLANVAVLPTEPGMTCDLGIVDTTHYWRHRHCLRGSPLGLAAMGDSIEAFCALLSGGCRADKLTWAIVAGRNDVSFARLLVANNQRLGKDSGPSDPAVPNPLIGPIDRHNKELLLLLLSADADVNGAEPEVSFGHTPLQFAVRFGDLDLVDCLLRHGAEFNTPPVTPTSPTALELAAAHGHLGIARLLLDRGACVNASDARPRPRSAMEAAAENGKLDMLEFLLQSGTGTSGDWRCQYIRSLMTAAGEEHAAAVKVLFNAGGWTDEDEHLVSRNPLQYGCASMRRGRGHVGRVTEGSESPDMAHGASDADEAASLPRSLSEDRLWQFISRVNGFTFDGVGDDDSETELVLRIRPLTRESHRACRMGCSRCVYEGTNGSVNRTKRGAEMYQRA